LMRWPATRMRPLACTFRWARRDPAGSGGGKGVDGVRALESGELVGGDRAGPAADEGVAGDGVHQVPVQP
jgi:hypothetical protein